MILGIFLTNSVYAEEAENQADDQDQEEDDDDDGYQVRVLKFAESDEENLEQFGIHTNPFHLNISHEIFENNDESIFFYTVNSKYVSSKQSGHNAYKIHNNVIVPVLSELKGLMKYFVFDC